MIRVTKKMRAALRAEANRLWAEYTKAVAYCLRDQADRAANRPVSFEACKHLERRDNYLRWYEQADRFARKRGA